MDLNKILDSDLLSLIPLLHLLVLKKALLIDVYTKRSMREVHVWVLYVDDLTYC